MSRPKTASEARKQDEARRRADLDDLRKIVATPEGKRYISRLLTQCNVFGVSLDPNGSRMYWKEGVRSVGVGILNELSFVAPHLLTELLHKPAEQPIEEADESDDSD
jgi:hypothetical protein